MKFKCYCCLVYKDAKEFTRDHNKYRRDRRVQSICRTCCETGARRYLMRERKNKEVLKDIRKNLGKPHH